ncbi:FtsX-like permease family protein [bacterium]|nr:FtsX-like permease family protein [bacterium]
MSLLARSQWRHLWRHPWLLLLSLVGVAVGVAGIVSMDLAVATCERAFRLSQESLTGRATHWIVAGQSNLDESFYTKLRVELGLRPCAPVVEGYVSVRDQSFRLLGVDPIAEGPFRGAWMNDGQANSNLASAFACPAAVAMSSAEAARLGLKMDSVLPVPGSSPMRLKALLTGLKPNQEQALQGLMLCDIAVAQEVLGLEGKLSRIELIVSDAQAKELQNNLPQGVSLVVAATRSHTAEQMSAAFFLNLRALSLLSLLVGGLLIYNVIHFLALQRRPWMAQLRILGVTRQEIRAQILAEAGWMGAWGTLLGLMLGITLSRLLLPLLTRTINDLYYNLQISDTYLSPLSLAKGCLLGWGCSLLAAWLPAHEAASTPPVQSLRRSQLETDSRRWMGKVAGLASLWLILSWVILVAAETQLALNLLAMMGLIVGSAALTPAAVVWLHGRLLHGLPAGFLQLRIILGGVERSLSRLGVALVAMTVALSAVVSITMMVFSFRISLLDWLDRTLGGDLYIGQANRQAAKAGQGLDPELVNKISAQAEVDRVIRVRMAPVYFRSDSGQTQVSQLVARDLDVTEMRRLRFVLGRPVDHLNSDELLATEPFLRQHQLAVNSQIELETRRGRVRYRLVGGVQDYASDSGYLVMDMQVYQASFEDRLISGMAVLLKGGQPEALRARILSWPGAENLELRSQKALHKLSVEIFEQTFQVTRLLQILAVVVAGLGTLGAVAANQLERRREFALWECLGLTRWERLRIHWGEAALCGLWAGLAAWPCGILQAYAMVHYINRRAFGWSLDFHIDPASLLITPLLGMAAATLAVWLARPMNRGPAEDLRQE